MEAIGRDDYMEAACLSPRERAAVLWAEHVTKNTARGRDDVFAQVREVFSEAEIVELTVMCGFFNFYNRFTDSLHIPLEVHNEVRKIKRNVRLDPEIVRSYLQKLLDNWPRAFPEPPQAERAPEPAADTPAP